MVSKEKVSTTSTLSAIRKLRPLLTREEKFNLLRIVCFVLATSLLEVVTASIIVVFAQVLNQPEIGQKYSSMIGLEDDLSPGRVIFYLAIGVGVVYLIKNLVAAAEVFYQNFSIQKMNYMFKSKMLQLYAKSDYVISLSQNASKRYNLIEGDVHQMFAGGMVALASIVSEGAIFLSLVILVVYLDPSIFFAVLMFSILCGLFVVKVLLPLFYTWGNDLQKEGEKSTQNLLQFFHGLKEIILLGKQQYFVEKYQVHSQAKSRIHAKQSTINAFPRLSIEILFMGLFITIIAMTCYEHETPKDIFGILGGYFYAGFRLMPGINRVINQLSIFKSITSSINRVKEEYDRNFNEMNCYDLDSFSFNKSIVLNNVTFQYPNTSKKILENISWEIKKGQSIGIIGETGCGKSTAIDLMLGLLRPSKGEVLIDGKFQANCKQWHQRIGYVPQAIYLIDDTVQANIAFGEKEVDLKRLNEAIDAAQLRAFINQLSQGYQTMVGERGVRLSGGEKQRIAIARALYRNPEVLIFDEATSALDTETEKRLMETIRKVSKNRTVIMIAHRLSTLKDCDQIVRVQDRHLQVLSKA